MSLSLEALNLFAQLLGGVQLDAMDPQLEEKAAVLVRVRAELATAIQEAASAEAGEAPVSLAATHASGCGVSGSASYGRETPIACTCGAE
jgi:hypothetical protein